MPQTQARKNGHMGNAEVPWSTELALFFTTLFTFVAVWAGVSIVVSVPLNVLNVDIPEAVSVILGVGGLVLAFFAARAARRRSMAEWGLS